jgi:hypothetical protein
MSSEHWFDRLARPHDRRSLLKAALGAGAAITLPQLRTGVSAAAVAGQLPCYKPCLQAAADAWSQERDACRTYDQVGQATNLFTHFLTLGPVGTTAWTWNAVFVGAGFIGCVTTAELHWRRNNMRCQGSECGDPVKYPGGVAPGQPKGQCDPTFEVLCGDKCCDISNGKAECCHCAGGTDICYAVGACDAACR